MIRFLFALSIVCLVQVVASAQVATQQVPPVYVEPGTSQHNPWINGSPPGDITYQAPTPASFSQQLSPAEQMASLMPPGVRKGFFQKANGSFTWMPRLESDSVGMTAVQTNIVTAVPFPHRYTPLMITPQYTLRLWDGPDFIDVPARLHDLELKFNHIRPITDKWVFNGGVTVGTYGDDHSLDASDSVRASGYALGIYQSTPQSPHKWIFGAVYVNRAGWSVFPAVGYMYKTDDFRVDVTFPRPKVAWRTWSQGRSGTNERWWYVQGDFGGGIWSVRRDGGADDTLSYSDVRLLVGTERVHIGHLSTRLEVGYVFARRLEYDSISNDFDLDDTIFVRGALKY